MTAKHQDPKPGANRPGVTWGQRLGREECPYMRRWVLNLGLFAIRLHHWSGSDDERHLHDHPWPFLTIVLKGGYTDVSAQVACPRCDQFDWRVERDEHGLAAFCNVCGADGNYTVSFDPLRWGEGVKWRGWRAAIPVRLRHAHHTHTVQVDEDGCWTLLITRRERRRFGYWVEGKWINAKRYFIRHGMHPCE